MDYFIFWWKFTLQSTNWPIFMQIGEPGYFMVLVGPCVDHFIKFLKKVISVKMGHGTYHQGVLKKIIFTGPFKGCGKKTTVQECQRRHKKIPPSEIKELHCNKVPLTRNYVRNYPFKSNNQVYYNTVGQRNYTFWNFIRYGEKDYWLISQQIRHKKQVQLFFQ